MAFPPFLLAGSGLSRSLLTLGSALSLSLLGHPGWGQTLSPRAHNSPFRLLPTYEPVYAYAQQLPIYKDGGNDGLLALLKQHPITRPPGTQRLFLSFTVDKEGKPTQPTLNAVPSTVRLPTSTYHEVARLLNRMSDFVPAQQNGNPVNFSLTVPLLPVEEANQGIR